jgi:hypothetical protein
MVRADKIGFFLPLKERENKKERTRRTQTL